MAAELDINGGVFDLLKRSQRGEVIAPIAEGVVKAASNWGRKVLPKHFDSSAFRAYPQVYVRRVRSYRRRKRSEHGHDDPNVFTGESRRLALGGFHVRRSGRSRGFKAQAKFPMRVANFHSPAKGSRINMRAELTAMNERDRRQAIRIVKDTAQAGVARAVAQRKRKKLVG